MKKTITLLLFAVFLLCSSTASAQWYNPGWWNLDTSATINIGTMDDGFITEWKTTNTNQSITIPVDTSEASYFYVVDWGDGTSLEVVSEVAGDIPNATHTYSTAGTYTVKILPIDIQQVSVNTYTAEYKGFPRINFNNTGSKDQLHKIVQWGVVKFSSFENAFYGCSNLLTVPTSEPTADGGFLSFQNIFKNASQLNSTLGGWNILIVNNMLGALDGSGLDVFKYNNTLSGWANQNVLQGPLTLGAAGLIYCETNARDTLINNGWTITGDTFQVCEDCIVPTNLSVFEYFISGTGATLTWNHPDLSQQNWQFYVSLDPNATPPNTSTTNLISTAPFPNNTNKDISGLTPNTEFFFWVRANCDAFGFSPWSSRLTVFTPPSCIAPSDVIITDVSNQTAKITPIQGSDETSYEYRVWNNDANFNQIPWTATNSTEWIVLPLTPDTNYIVYVKAVCDGVRGESVETPSRLFKTRPTDPVPGDLCSFPVFLPDVSSTYNGNTNGAYHDNSQDCLPGGTSDLIGRDRVYIISIPDGSGIIMNHTSNFNSISRAAFGTNSNCPGDNLIQCGDSQAMSQVIWSNTTGSSKIFYWVESGDGSETGTFTLDWQILPVADIPLTYIPDPNFEAYLEANNMGNSIPNDQLVLTDLIVSQTYLNLYNQNIADLTGIEDFTALTTLHCQVNQLTTLDLSQNLNLSTVWANENQLTSVNLGNNTNYLESQGLWLTGNPYLFCVSVGEQTTADLWNSGYFHSGDGTTSIQDLQTIFSTDCTRTTLIPDANFENYLETHNASGAVVPLGNPASMGNGIANDNLVLTNRIIGVIELDVTNENINDLTGIEDFASLTELTCEDNPLTILNVTQNLSLTFLDLEDTLITELDVSQNLNLDHLRIGNTPITELDISKNLNLTYISAGGANSQLISLDASLNTNLTDIIIWNSTVLTSLNLRNGNNTTVINCFLTNNPNLTCVQVDNQAYSVANWVIDDANVFSDYCTEFLTYVPDNNFENYLETHNANGAVVPLGDPTSMGNGIANDNYVFTPSISGVTTSLNLFNKNIADLTGIEGFVAITALQVSDNPITNLDVSQNHALTELSAVNCQLRNLYLSSNANYSAIFGLNLSNNPDLTCITVDDQAIADLWNTNYFNNGSGNSTLDPQMEFNTFCVPYGSTYIPDDNFENYLETHNASGAVVALGSSSSLGNGIANDDLVITSKLGGLNGFEGFNFNGLSIASLEGIQDFTNLLILVCSNNLLTSVNLEDLPPNLLIAVFDDNPLAQIEGNNSVLEGLACSNTNLTSLDVSNCPALEGLWANDNPQLVSLNVKNGNNVNFGQVNVPIKTTNCPNLTCIEVDDVAYSITNWTEIDVHTAFSNNCGEVTLEAKAYLQGAFMNPNAGEETLMRDDLRTLADFPLTSPYGDGLTITATELAVSGPDAIVDWIWVELRDDATNTTVMASQSALLQRDGDIVDVDGLSPIVFTQSAKHYNVVIKHRNHAGIMTSARVPFPKDQVVDFKTGAMTSFGTYGQADISGTFALWAGDLNGDGQIRYLGPGNDSNTIKSSVLNPTNGNPSNSNFFFYNAYDNADINMNGSVRYLGPNNDTSILKSIIVNHPENTTNSNFFPFSNQIPN